MSHEEQPILHLGDQGQAIITRLFDENGDAVDVTGNTNRMKIWKPSDEDSSPSIDDAGVAVSGNEIRYVLQPGDLSEVGKYTARGHTDDGTMSAHSRPLYFWVEDIP